MKLVNKMYKGIEFPQGKGLYLVQTMYQVELEENGKKYYDEMLITIAVDRFENKETTATVIDNFKAKTQILEGNEKEYFEKEILALAKVKEDLQKNRLRIITM